MSIFFDLFFTHWQTVRRSLGLLCRLPDEERAPPGPHPQWSASAASLNVLTVWEVEVKVKKTMKDERLTISVMHQQ